MDYEEHFEDRVLERVATEQEEKLGKFNLMLLKFILLIFILCNTN